MGKRHISINSAWPRSDTLWPRVNTVSHSAATHRHLHPQNRLCGCLMDGNNEIPTVWIEAGDEGGARSVGRLPCRCIRPAEPPIPSAATIGWIWGKRLLARFMSKCVRKTGFPLLPWTVRSNRASYSLMASYWEELSQILFEFVQNF